MASKNISRLTVYTTGQPINANEHNAEHQQYVDNFNELFQSFDYSAGIHKLKADYTKFTFTSLNLEEILSTSHNPDGTVKADKVVDTWANMDISSFLQVAHNSDGTIKSDGINDPLIQAHNTDITAHPDIRQKITGDINAHNTDTTAHQDIRDILNTGIVNNSDMVDGYHASVAPSATTVVVSDTDSTISQWQTKNTTEKLQTLTVNAGVIDWDLSLGNVAQVILTGNATLNVPTNMRAGGTYILIVKQDATGGWTLSYDTTVYKFADGTPFDVATNPNAVSILTFISDGTNMYASGVANLL